MIVCLNVYSINKLKFGFEANPSRSCGAPIPNFREGTRVGQIILDYFLLSYHNKILITDKLYRV